MNALLNAITDAPDWTDTQIRRDYMRILERYARTHAGPCEEQLAGADCEAAARDLMDALEARWKSLSFFIRSGERENDRIRAVLFLFPMLLRSARPECAAFAEALRIEWCRRYPGRSFGYASAEEIAAGFQKRPLEFDWKRIFGGTRE